MPTPTTTTFTPTGAAQTFVVPYYTAGTFRVTCRGAIGNRASGVPAGAAGPGGSIRGYWAVAPGTVLSVVAGYSGAFGHLDLAAYRGGMGGKEIAGGAVGTGRGGGASLILVGSTIVIIAGGGGGAGQSGGLGGGAGGRGGLGIGSGANGGESPRGFGATTSAVGAHGTYAIGYATVPTDGVLHAGGLGSAYSSTTNGGGGGGGYFGGGGAGAHVFIANGDNDGGGGGGGSSWCDSGLFTSIDDTGTNGGDGSVTLEYDWIADWSPPTDGWSVGFLKF